MLPSNSNHNQQSIGTRWIAAALLTCLGAASASVQAGHTRIKGLLDLALPELMQVHALTMSKQSQSVWDSAAAMSVVDQSDIRASGATTIADVLRLVPGVQVAQIDAGGYSVSIRGFSSRTARKILVMIDGRTVYSQGFAGTFWEIRDMPLEIIERIEVLRGPGGTLWGANAQNGVVNIITKPAHLMQGTQLSLGSGNEQPGIGFASWGGRLTNHLNGRFHAQVKSGDDSYARQGAPDGYLDSRAGFRLDSEGTPARVFTLDGEWFHRAGGTVPRPGATKTDGDTQGGHLMARIRHSTSRSSTHQIQFYASHYNLWLESIGRLRETLADIDYQFNYTGWTHHDLVMGVGFRHARDQIEAQPDAPEYEVDPMRSQHKVSNVFLQDRVHLPWNLHATTGLKIERNDLSGTEFQPTLRVDWAPEFGGTLWAAWSRASRTPARFEQELSNLPNPDLDAETVDAFELGLRHRVSRHSTVEISAYENHYDDLIGPEPDPALPPNLKQDNSIRGTVRGIELEGRWEPRPHWELRSGYTHLSMNLEAKSGHSTSIPGLAKNYDDLIEGSDPRHRAYLQSRNEIGTDWTLNSTLRHVGKTDRTKAIPAYTELDIAAVWAPRANFTLDLIGRNLLDSKHPEADGSPYTGNTEIERSLLIRGNWQF